ncbi:PLC-like phosphodiesterase [Lobosporangium transversale]|uniref:PLC-like phosphodiesterase n=1 Tax=Lobosporangium transversale TaxID=64571 RepID=A0A1Y2GM70_9FUNG|nr:PLC-like phosphodiesterase [Lobosporangium transversale]ORZ11393.1 PLC-like phosphodiesterase [Lobosporangium transversale]|eukprot:XP_021879708.1 PLC-like phosphodiesterase [Lobosporangium transversale]
MLIDLHLLLSFPSLFYSYSYRRGASEQWPENSIISMAQAIKDGADGLEGDLHLTSDGEIIVMHDPSLDRTTNGTGLVKNRPWHGYIDGLKSKKEPHVGVPRCVDVLAFLAQEGNEKVWWNIDIKMNNSPALLFSKFAKLMEDNFPGRDFSSQIVLGLWHPKFLLAADKYLPRFSRIHIGFSIPIATEHFPPSKVDGYSISFMVLSTPQGRQFIKEMQAAGKTILAWTVNDVVEIRECVNMGVDYILTDRTKVLHNVLQEYEKLGREGVEAKYADEEFNTWSRWSRYTFWRALFWVFLTIRFNNATKRLDVEPGQDIDFSTGEEILVK